MLGEILGFPGRRLEAVAAGAGAFELRTDGAPLPHGWVSVDLRCSARARLLVDSGSGFANSAAMDLPLPRAGRIAAVVELPPHVARLGLETDAGVPGEVRMRSIGRIEMAVRFGLPVIRRRLAEPWSIPLSALRLGRALWHGDLLLRLSQKQATEAPQLRYAEWYDRFATLSADDRAGIRAAITRLPDPPRFSILVGDAAEETIASVRAQLYERWEICGTMADAKGDYVLALDGSDRLAEHALYLLAAEICADRGTDLVYGDEDRIDAQGGLHSPDFKPGWNPDLLLSDNYFGHACAVRLSAARAAGGYDDGRWALFLRVAARSGAVRHVPFIVDHRAGAISSEPSAVSTVQGYLGDAAAVETGPFPGTCRVRWPVPAEPPLVTLVIPTRDRRDLLERCVESLLARTTYRNFELIVVDNGSRDPSALGYLESLQRRDLARVLRDARPFNFPALNNLAVGQARGTLIGLLNNDLEVIEPGWLDELVSHAVRPEVGAAGARLLYPDGTVQHAGVILGIGGLADHVYKNLPGEAPGYRGRAHLTQDLSAVTAACLLVRKDVYLDAGGLDEDFAVAFNDVDFCLRLRARGLRIVWTPWATLVHHESKSRGREDSLAKMRRFRGEMARLRARWGGALLDDPAYNPNLTLDATNVSLAWPSRARKPWRATVPI